MITAHPQQQQQLHLQSLSRQNFAQQKSSPSSLSEGLYCDARRYNASSAAVAATWGGRGPAAVPPNGAPVAASAGRTSGRNTVSYARNGVGAQLHHRFSLPVRLRYSDCRFEVADANLSAFRAVSLLHAAVVPIHVPAADRRLGRGGATLPGDPI